MSSSELLGFLVRGRGAEGTEAELSKTLQASESEGTHFDVIVRGDATKASRALDGIEAVIGCTVEEKEDGLLAIEVEARTDVREQAAQRLIEAGLGLRRLTPRSRGELESIFLKLTGGGQA